MKLIVSQLTIVAIISLFSCAAVHAQAKLQGIVIEDPIAGPLIQEPISNSIEELPPSTSVIADGLLPTEQLQTEGAELVTERYDNRKVKIEREVIQDEDQNFINHGKWKQYDRKGNVIVEGRYRHSEMDGVWTRLYFRRDVALLNKAPFNQGQLPLISQANFKYGKLHGKWIIYDAHKQKLCEWEFTNGKRNGRSTWWFVNGLKMREIDYRDGIIDGELNQWDRTGRQVTKDRYEDGSRIAKKTDYYPDRAKRAEGTVKYPKLRLETADNWMECSLATYSREGNPVKHGPWVSWYPNGQKKLEGNYEDDAPSGSFTQWHDNGQRSMSAKYVDGIKQGLWTWWHPSGLKSIQGKYVNDQPVEKWLWWEESGKVAYRTDMSTGDVLPLPGENNGVSRTRQTSVVK